jgi:hypothetical protein
MGGHVATPLEVLLHVPYVPVDVSVAQQRSTRLGPVVLDGTPATPTRVKPTLHVHGQVETLVREVSKTALAGTCVPHEAQAASLVSPHATVW